MRCFSSDQQIHPQVGSSTHPRWHCPRRPCRPQPSRQSFPHLLRQRINGKRHFEEVNDIFSYFTCRQRWWRYEVSHDVCAQGSALSSSPSTTGELGGWPGGWKPLTTIITNHSCLCVTLIVAGNSMTASPHWYCCHQPFSPHHTSII